MSKSGDNAEEFPEEEEDSGLQEEEEEVPDEEEEEVPEEEEEACPRHFTPKVEPLPHCDSTSAS